MHEDEYQVKFKFHGDTEWRTHPRIFSTYQEGREYCNAFHREELISEAWVTRVAREEIPIQNEWGTILTELRNLKEHWDEWQTKEVSSPSLYFVGALDTYRRCAVQLDEIVRRYKD